MKKFTIICLLLMFAVVTESVAKNDRELIKGNYYYNHGDYFAAIPHLEKATAISRNADIYGKLGDCYTITGDLKNAEKSYSKAVTLRGCKKEVFLHYAQLLMQVAKYKEAEDMLVKYQKTSRKDERIDNLIEGCRTAKALSEQMPDGLITFLPFNTDKSEFAPARWHDMLVFASDGGKYLDKRYDPSSGNDFYDIYFSRCNDSGTTSGYIIPLDSAGKTRLRYHNGPCTFSGDGKKMYYTRSVYNSKRVKRGPVPRADSTVVLETMIATYDSLKDRFVKVESFEHNSREYAVAHAAVSPNGLVMALSSDMPRGKGGSDIYICKKSGADGWSKPVNAGTVINTTGDELFPSWADDSTLSFSSNGHPGLGGLDIYTSHWDTKTNTFDTPANIGIPINSSSDDITLALKTDKLNTWFSSSRPAAKDGDNIYFYRAMKVYLQLLVVDSATRQPLRGATVTTGSANIPDVTVISSDGSYFARLWPGDRYTINVAADGYVAGKASVLSMTPLPVDTLKVTVELHEPRRRKDTLATQLAGTTVMRNVNVMDSPGIRNFTVDQVYEVGDFQYDYGKYELNASHQQFLDTMLTQLRRNPNMRIELQAHTDCRGSVASNKILSDKRALSVVNYFVKHGITRKRLEYAGLGNTNPKVPCPDCNSCTEKEHSLNRILEFKVLQM